MRQFCCVNSQPLYKALCQRPITCGFMSVAAACLVPRHDGCFTSPIKVLTAPPGMLNKHDVTKWPWRKARICFLAGQKTACSFGLLGAAMACYKETLYNMHSIIGEDRGT